VRIPRIRFLIIGLVLILSSAAYRAHLLRQFNASSRKGSSGTPVTRPVTNELDRMAASDPDLDATRAIASNDLRFVAIAGNYAPPIPGINSQERSLNTNGIKWVDGSDRFSTRTYYQAAQYATRYNERIVQHLRASVQKN
jgi:hypothetical protein